MSDCAAHRVTVAQMSLAVIVGVVSTVLNVWLLYKQHHACDTTELDGSDACQISLNQTMTSVNTGTLRPTGKGKPSAGFDNPNWVYGEEKGSVRSQQQQHRTTSRPGTSVSVISDGVRTDGGNGVVRYATIRRAPSILNALPADQHARRHLKSASFRMEGERNLLRAHRASSAAVSRSKTMRETSFSAPHYARFADGPHHTFAQRFQSSADGALSFVHDVTTEEEEAAAAESSVISIDPPVASAKVSNGAQTSAIMEEETSDDDGPTELPVVRRQVRSSDRIVLRVESFRTVQSCGIPVRAPTAPLQRPHVVRNSNVKRVSSSTQTELSVLKPVSVGLVAAQQQRMQKRPLPQTSYPTLKNGSSTTAQTTTNNHSQVSPVESSSGYSSPRGTESKSPTPEPKQHEQQLDRDGSDAANQDPANVTVIQIDPNPPATKKEAPQYVLAPISEATYAIPRKRAERKTTATSPGLARNQVVTPPHRDADFQVSINTKPVHRSASFQHMSQAGRKDYYSNEWLRAGALLENQPVMTIPRPMLKGSHQQRYSSAVSRRHHGDGDHRSSSSGSSLSRSTSMYLAMSEIQRKLDSLQWLGPRAAAVRNEMAPVHRASYSSNDEYYTSSGYSRHSEAPRRNRSRTSSRQMTAPLPAPPPPPAANPLELDETIDSAKTLAYLSELEMLARHWRTQLLYKVN